METDPGPFTGRSVDTVARQLRERQFDPVELVQRVLAAIDATQPTINAFVTVDRAGALTAAALARDELNSGIDRGRLHGVPIGIKDIVDTAGLATTMGSRHFAGNVPTHDAGVVTRLREAGAIVVGKTTTHEFAYGPTGDRAANGACANPHDPTRMAGGSSAGSAAAVAAGLVPLAIGTDTGGSVRIPAALCGVVGIRPSFGRVPTDGVFPLSWSLDTVGVLAADVAGTAYGWGVLTASAETASPPSRLRLGVPATHAYDHLAEPVAAAMATLRTRLADPGVQTVPLGGPDPEELLYLYRTIQSVEAVSIHHDRMTRAPELFDPEVLQRLGAAAEVPARDYAVAMRRLNELRTSAVDLLADCDAILLPTLPIAAPPLGTRNADLGGGWRSAREALLAHTAPWSVLGLPSMSLPAPVAPGDLPIGVQLIGPGMRDEHLLAVAATIERLLR